MTPSESEVGPVLLPNELGLAVLAAIQAENPQVQVRDRGAYLRVSVASRCVVTRHGIELSLGRAVSLPADLELCMASFKGRLSIDADGAKWEAAT